mgnify:CR=1 FL=1|tara:strand:+ start:5706 stop:6656 length:951 start_codon:yes stop_codon:yes gene_type:complete
MRRARHLLTLPAKAISAVAFAVLLSACVPQGPGVPPRPEPVAQPGDTASAASRAMRTYYAGIQANLLSRGMMRTDGGTRDAPFNARILADNFIRIALFDEFDSSTGNLVARATESRLRRWNVPVRVGLNFGASVPESRRASDRARIASFLARLSRLTGLSIRLADSQVNFFLYIVDEDERRAIGPVVAAAMPGVTATDIAAFTRMPTSTYCQVSAMIENETSLYRRAFAVIRAEHPDLINLSCLHEEITQGLGLPNDSPQARPSIYNDDQEFALMTPMDELMLRMLYDPRLKPGMSVSEARPIVQKIAREMLGNGT